MNLTISIGQSRFSTNWEKKTVSWDELAEKLTTFTKTNESAAEYAAMTKDQQIAVKDIGGFVGGELIGVRRTAGSVKYRCLLCLDVDYAGPSLTEAWDLLAGYAAVIHSTHSHTAENPRLRIVMPMTRPVDADEYEAIARRVAGMVGIDQFDSTTFQPSRLMFWPSCPKDITPVAVKFDDDDWLNPDEILATYRNWRDMSEWPRCSRETRDLHETAEKAEDPTEKPGWIGAFCRTYTITDAIVKFLPDKYSQVSEFRWTYNAGHSVGGAIVYDDKFLYSYHDTDPVNGRCCNAYDLVRIHLFGAMDSGYTGDWADSPSQKKMEDLCREDTECFETYTSSFTSQLNAEDAPLIEDVALKSVDADQDYAIRFANAYGRMFRYSASLGWLYWDGKRWKGDSEPEVLRLLLKFNNEVMDKAIADEAKTGQKGAVKLAKKMRSETQINKILSLVKRTREVVLSDVSMLDADAWTLNTPDGMIDLKTGSVKPSDPAAFCTKITSCGVGTTENRGMWQQFVEYITGHDVNVAEFLQRVIGMAAVGAVYEEGAILSYGKGSNGKSTFYGAIMDVLNDYARPISPDLLVREGRQGSGQFETATLFGVRLALMSETGEGNILKAEPLKRLTSGDQIIGQKKFKDAFVFTPSHTSIIQTNYLPRLTSFDKGTLRRLTVVEFPTTITPEHVITDYRRKLVEQCGPDILSWIVEGAVRFYNDGCRLVKPQKIEEITNGYVEGEDTLGAFISNCCEVGEGYEAKAHEIYEAYCRFQAESDGTVLSTHVFGRRMTERFEKKVTATGRVYKGVKLK